MSPLLLHCGLCGRKQAAGILSRAAWGTLALSDGKNMSACPTCKEEHADWEDRLRASGAGTPPNYGSSYR